MEASVPMLLQQLVASSAGSGRDLAWCGTWCRTLAPSCPCVGWGEEPQIMAGEGCENLRLRETGLGL